MSFSTRLVELRKLRGLTQKDLAAATGISYSAISKYEANIIPPGLPNVLILHKFFGVNIEYLLDLED